MTLDLAPDNPYGITSLVFGASKAGKSNLGDTAPKPLLVIDAEGGSRFTPSRKITWDPTRPVPARIAPDGGEVWETAVVHARSYQDVQRAFQVLSSGNHPFRSVTLDSISEIQQRAIDHIAGLNQMSQPDWGNLLRTMSELIRSFRDLVVHPTNPLDAVTFIAMAKRDKDTALWRPYAQGQLATTLPYYVDVCAYLAAIPATETTAKTWRLFVEPVPGFETGERLNGCLGPFIDHANIADMVQTVRRSIALKEGSNPE